MSGNTITYFMWGYQQHFRSAQEGFADRVFHTLDQRFKPKVFLVGILANDKAEKFPACVEPEKDFWIHSERFNGVPALAKTLLPFYPESGMFQSHPLAQQRQDEALFHRSIRDGVQKTIQAASADNPDVAYFVSFPGRVEDYLVCVVLGLQRDIIDSYYALKGDSLQIHEHRSAQVAVSLIDATVHQFLEHARHELLKPDPGLAARDVDAEDLIRAAGRALCRDTVGRIDNHRIEGRYGLFTACTTISSLRYEKSAGSGTMVLCRKNHPSVSSTISLVNPVASSKFRAVRKLFQLTSGELSLHSDSEHVFGLVKLRKYDETREDLFEMRVMGHHHWELRHGGKALMSVRYGIPSLPRRSFDEDKLRRDLPRIFKSITPRHSDRLLKLIRTAEEASHGALLIISERAPSEAQRLQEQGTPITPRLLTARLLRHLTTIDGAILISPKGTCYGIGTILDGRATQGGDPGRGARYNSALRYVYSEWPCLGVVVSEDGGIDFIPNLRPAIRRSKIEKTIAEIDRLRGAKPIRRTRYYAAIEFINEHRFYLRKEDCDALNSLVKSIEEQFRQDDQLFISQREFIPNTGLDEELFYEKE